MPDAEKAYESLDAVLDRLAGIPLGALSLDGALRKLHTHGYWIAAWYPLTDGRFECRITQGAANGRGWGVDPDPLAALIAAMTMAEVPS